MGEKQNQPFQLRFNASWGSISKVRRSLPTAVWFWCASWTNVWASANWSPSTWPTPGAGRTPNFPLADLFRQSVHSRIAGYEDVNNAERISQDPTFRLIGSEKTWDRGAALTSRLQTFETEMLAEGKLQQFGRR
jgi:hypothetical protein